MPAPSDTEGRARPGRHRSETADRAILEAALAVLREAGYQRFTMSAVIERSGVSSATLYRRWPTKQALVVAAIGSMVVVSSSCDTGTLAGDLAAFLHARVVRMADEGPLLGDLHRDLVDDAEVTDAMRQCLLAPALAELAQILARAAARDELTGRAPATEVALSLVLGPLHHRVTVLRQPVGPAFERAVVRQVVAGLQG